MPPTTSTRSTSQTSGATWRHLGGRRPRRERLARPWRGLVVRDARDWPASGRRPFPRRGDTAASQSSDRTMHDNDSRTCQRSGARARRRPSAASFGGQPRLRRECVARRTTRPARPVERSTNAPGVRRPRGRGRLLELSDDAGGFAWRSGEWADCASGRRTERCFRQPFHRAGDPTLTGLSESRTYRWLAGTAGCKAATLTHRRSSG